MNSSRLRLRGLRPCWATRAIAVNAKDERYTHLHGKKVLLPLMNREIPIITDELAQPEFGTGAVKVTPAHDPNDFQAGLAPQPSADQCDGRARAHERERRRVCGPRPLRSARARVCRSAKSRAFWSRKRITRSQSASATAAAPSLSRGFRSSGSSRSSRWRSAPSKPSRAARSRFAPENYSQIYLNWMNNIYDWCISRQLWWGHRIPAWTCGDCKEMIVAREAPTKCTKCGGAKLEQDTDVLDTWFSSGLLPFTTLGWPEKTRDLEVFYPNTLLITGFDILFFWVARMIMFGCHFMQGHEQDPAIKKASGWSAKNRRQRALPPCLHPRPGARRRRQKMSKTKGNVIDPLEIIERFGTDATRFTLAAMAAPGTDIAFSESRTDGYRAFANKIWNAARFMFMNVDRIESGADARSAQRESRRNSERGVAGFPLDEPSKTAGFSLASIAWPPMSTMRSQTYRFHEAANRIYDFFWGEFCDWYLELIKPRLISKRAATRQRAQACTNLVNLFEASLRLLHPVMPFITEEIWHAIYDGKPPLKSIALAAYPRSGRKADSISPPKPRWRSCRI